MAARTPERFVQQLSQAIEDEAGKSDGRIDLVRRKMRTVVRECGWTQSSRGRRAALGELLNGAGISHLPDVEDEGTSLDTWVRFSKRDLSNRPLGQIFSRERGLEDFIGKYFNGVFDDHGSLSGLSAPREQVPVLIGGRKKRMDLLFTDADGSKVVVEIKKADPSLGVVNQLREYMDALRRSSDTPVRGVIITAKPSTEDLESTIRGSIAKYAGTHQIEWYWYSVDVKLVAASTEAE